MKNGPAGLSTCAGAGPDPLAELFFFFAMDFIGSFVPGGEQVELTPSRFEVLRCVEETNEERKGTI